MSASIIFHLGAIYSAPVYLRGACSDPFFFWSIHKYTYTFVKSYKLIYPYKCLCVLYLYMYVYVGKFSRFIGFAQGFVDCKMFLQNCSNHAFCNPMRHYWWPVLSKWTTTLLSPSVLFYVGSTQLHDTSH